MNNTNGTIFVTLGSSNPTATATAGSSFTGVNSVKLSIGSYYEVPYRYVGRVTIIKHTDVSAGSVTVTEIS